MKQFNRSRKFGKTVVCFFLSRLSGVLYFCAGAKVFDVVRASVLTDSLFLRSLRIASDLFVTSI